MKIRHIVVLKLLFAYGRTERQTNFNRRYDGVQTRLKMWSCSELSKSVKESVIYDYILGDVGWGTGGGGGWWGEGNGKV